MVSLLFLLSLSIATTIITLLFTVYYVLYIILLIPNRSRRFEVLYSLLVKKILSVYLTMV